jgi:hypothetical protein
LYLDTTGLINLINFCKFENLRKLRKKEEVLLIQAKKSRFKNHNNRSAPRLRDFSDTNLSCFTDKQIIVALIELGFDLLDKKSSRILMTMKINFAFIDQGLDEKLSCFTTVRQNNYRNYQLKLSCFTDHEHN